MSLILLAGWGAGSVPAGASVTSLSRSIRKDVRTCSYPYARTQAYQTACASGPRPGRRLGRRLSCRQKAPAAARDCPCLRVPRCENEDCLRGLAPVSCRSGHPQMMAGRASSLYRDRSHRPCDLQTSSLWEQTASKAGGTWPTLDRQGCACHPAVAGESVLELTSEQTGNVPWCLPTGPCRFRPRHGLSVGDQNHVHVHGLPSQTSDGSGPRYGHPCGTNAWRNGQSSGAGELRKVEGLPTIYSRRPRCPCAASPETHRADRPGVCPCLACSVAHGRRQPAPKTA